MMNEQFEWLEDQREEREWGESRTRSPSYPTPTPYTLPGCTHLTGHSPFMRECASVEQSLSTSTTSAPNFC